LAYLFNGNKLENVEYFSYLSSMITSDSKCIHPEKAAFINKKNVFTSKLDLSLREKLMKCYIWSITLYGAENWKLRKNG